MKGVLSSIRTVWRKAEREAYRSYHAKSRQHKADHFFNFCITAHSLKDYFFEHKNIQGASRGPYHAQWAAKPLLVTVAEIANLSKHFQLRDHATKQSKRPVTRHIVHRASVSMAVYVTPTGAITMVPEPSRELLVTTSDGVRHELWALQIDVLDYWRVFLRQHGIRIRRQTVSEMRDRSADL